MEDIIVLRDMCEEDANNITAVLKTAKTDREVGRLIAEVKAKHPHDYNFEMLKEVFIRNGIEVYDVLREIYW